MVPFCPTCGTCEPAVELTITTLAGSIWVPAVVNSGVKLVRPSVLPLVRNTDSQCSQSNQVKDPSNVQIQDFERARVWHRVERTSPGCSSVGDQDINPVFRLLDLIHQSLDLHGLRYVRSNGDRDATDAWKLVQAPDSLVKPPRSSCFTCGNEHLPCTGLQ